MIRRIVSLLLSVSLAAVLGGLWVGCADDVEVIQQTEEVHESSAQPVAPGEPIVE
jgi:hypothetical protein